MPSVVARFDAAAERTVGRVRSPLLDHLAYGIGSACDHSLLWHTIGAIRSARAGDLRPSLRLSAALGVESALTNGPVKALFRRVRPAPPTGTDTTGTGTTGTGTTGSGGSGTSPARLPYGMRVPITSSFPSGHAAAAFCAAGILHADTGRRSWYALATVVAASRVYTRMHHASDVVAGAVWGSFLSGAIRVGWRQ